MGTKLVQSDTVVVGNFNPRIISPAWLVKEKVVSEQPTDNSVTFTGHTMVFGFRIGPFTWQVDDNRLIVLSEGAHDATDLVSAVVAKLPHTPLIAVGHNFRFSADHSTWKGHLPRLGDVDSKALGPYGEVKNVAWHVTLLRTKEVTVNIDLTEAEQAVSVGFNFHRDANNPEAVITAAKRFKEDLQVSEELLGSLFKAEVSR